MPHKESLLLVVLSSSDRGGVDRPPPHLFVHQWDEKSRGSRGRHGAGTLLPFLFVRTGKTDSPAAREQHKVVRRISNRKCCIEENKQDLPSVQIIQRRLQNPQASLSDGERDVRAGRQLKECFLGCGFCSILLQSGYIPLFPVCTRCAQSSRKVVASFPSADSSRETDTGSAGEPLEEPLRVLQ